MASLTSQLALLKKQTEEIEQRIKHEEDMKKKLENESSIERLEALIDPITEYLNYSQSGPGGNAKSHRDIMLARFERKITEWEINISNPRRRHDPPQKPIKQEEIRNEEIFVTLLGILKKQEKKILELESKLN